jgi:hypothetical protein
MQTFFKKVDGFHYVHEMSFGNILGELLVFGVMVFAACFLLLFIFHGISKVWPGISLSYIELVPVVVGAAAFGLYRLRSMTTLCLDLRARSIQARHIWTHSIATSASMDAAQSIAITREQLKSCVWHRVVLLFFDSESQFSLFGSSREETAVSFATEFASLTGIPFVNQSRERV